MEMEGIPDFLLVKNRPNVEHAAVIIQTREPEIHPALIRLNPQARAWVEDEISHYRLRAHWLDDPVTVQYIGIMMGHKAAAKKKPEPEEGLEVKERPKELPLDGVISYKGSNPKTPGTSAYFRWQRLRESTGMTVGAFKKDGGNMTTLRNAITQGRAEIKSADSITRSDQAAVPRQDGKRVRGEKKGSDQMAPGKRSRRKDAKGSRRKR